MTEKNPEAQKPEGTAAITVEGKEILLQKPDKVTKWYYNLRDSCKGQNGEVMRVPYVSGMINAVVVKPNDLDVNDFSINGLGEFMNKVEAFLRG